MHRRDKMFGTEITRKIGLCDIQIRGKQPIRSYKNAQKKWIFCVKIRGQEWNFLIPKLISENGFFQYKNA